MNQSIMAGLIDRLFLLMDCSLPGTSFPSNLGRVVVETETEERQTAKYRDQNPQSKDWTLNPSICHFLPRRVGFQLKNEKYKIVKYMKGYSSGLKTEINSFPSSQFDLTIRPKSLRDSYYQLFNILSSAPIRVTLPLLKDNNSWMPIVFPRVSVDVFTLLFTYRTLDGKPSTTL